MGAWDTDPFGNDTACDWAYSLEESENLDLIEETLAKIEDAGDEYIEAPDAEEAIAAADTLARLKGKFYVKNSYTEAVDAWVEEQQLDVPQDLVDLAVHAIERIQVEPSELRELWEESDDYKTWKKHLSDLKKRLQ
jgi:septation ring formation regulator EzrA